jgi:hypothetical protein
MTTNKMFGNQFVTACLAATLALSTTVHSSMADEPLWSNQERLERRDVVCVATVVSTENVGPIDQHADLHLAVIEVNGVTQGKKTAVGSKFHVYYENSASGQGKRCPAYAKLKKGDKATFYLRNMSEAIQKQLKIATLKEPALFLDMGSDVQKFAEILKVGAADTRLVTINVGGDDGAAVGQLFSVYRDDVPIGQLKVSQVERDQSTAFIEHFQDVVDFKPGDVVVRDVTFEVLHRMFATSKGEAPAREGRMYANADIHRGLTRILYFGKPWSQGKPFIDDETKYPVVIASGCVVGQDFVSFVNEYNRTMKEHFKKP